MNEQGTTNNINIMNDLLKKPGNIINFSNENNSLNNGNCSVNSIINVNQKSNKIIKNNTMDLNNLLNKMNNDTLSNTYNSSKINGPINYNFFSNESSLSFNPNLNTIPIITSNPSVLTFNNINKINSIRNLLNNNYNTFIPTNSTNGLFNINGDINGNVPLVSSGNNSQSISNDNLEKLSKLLDDIEKPTKTSIKYLIDISMKIVQFKREIERIRRTNGNSKNNDSNININRESELDDSKREIRPLINERRNTNHFISSTENDCSSSSLITNRKRPLDNVDNGSNNNNKKSKVFSKGKEKSSFKLDIHCPICLEELNSDKEYYTTICGHFFCKSCLEVSLKKKKICPLCRYDFNHRKKFMYKLFF